MPLAPSVKMLFSDLDPNLHQQLLHLAVVMHNLFCDVGGGTWWRLCAPHLVAGIEKDASQASYIVTFDPADDKRRQR